MDVFHGGFSTRVLVSLTKLMFLSKFVEALGSSGEAENDPFRATSMGLFSFNVKTGEGFVKRVKFNF